MVTQGGGASRRALLSGAGASLAGAGALVIGGCGRRAKAGRKAIKTVSPAAVALDLKLLEQALELERRTVAAYIAGIPLLPHPRAKVAEQFLNEELQHTGELLALIKAAGGKSPPRAASYDIGRPRDAGGVLALLHSLERLQIANYLQSIPRLAPGPLRAAVASILASDAQHIAILRAAQGLPAMASAFVTGAE